MNIFLLHDLLSKQKGKDKYRWLIVGTVIVLIYLFIHFISKI